MSIDVGGWRGALRETASGASVLLPFLGPKAPFGVTAVVRVKDEEDWLALSVQSLKNFADQVVIGDNGSTDGTPAVIERLKRDHPGWIEVVDGKGDDIKTLTNKLVQRARFRWVLRWDGDFIAQTEGPDRISLLKEELRDWGDKRHCLMYLRMVELAGDFWHQNAASRTRDDAHLWTASPALRYVYDEAGYESPQAPLWYAVRRREAPCFFHLHVKSDKRLFLNGLWKLWLLKKDGAGDFPGYVRAFCLDLFGSDDVDAAAAKWITLYAQRLKPVDRSLFRDYPALLRPLLERPPYRLKESDGTILGRDTLLSSAGRP
jgi:glycosyltransferase involved in cell wall biosynthesis